MKKTDNTNHTNHTTSPHAALATWFLEYSRYSKRVAKALKKADALSRRALVAKKAARKASEEAYKLTEDFLGQERGDEVPRVAFSQASHKEAWEAWFRLQETEWD